MMKGIGQLSGLLKQAQSMQAKFKEVQDALGEKTVEGSAGGGMVVVIVNGRQEILSIKIEPEVLKENDVEMLQDLVVAAVNQGMKASQEMMQQELGKVTGQAGLNIPGLG